MEWVIDWKCWGQLYEIGWILLSNFPLFIVQLVRDPQCARATDKPCGCASINKREEKQTVEWFRFRTSSRHHHKHTDGCCVCDSFCRTCDCIYLQRIRARARAHTHRLTRLSYTKSPHAIHSNERCYGFNETACVLMLECWTRATKREGKQLTTTQRNDRPVIYQNYLCRT